MLKNTFKDSISHQNSYQVNTYFSGEEIFKFAILKKFSIIKLEACDLDSDTEIMITNH